MPGKSYPPGGLPYPFQLCYYYAMVDTLKTTLRKDTTRSGEVVWCFFKGQGGYRMETLEQILKNHAHSYPKIQPQDAVKLIWQNVFGSGTLRRDPASYRCALMHEFEDTQTSAEVSLVENIGNGLVRINLAAAHWCGYSPERLGYDYVDSARRHQGSQMGFSVKLDVLRRVVRTGCFLFLRWNWNAF